MSFTSFNAAPLRTREQVAREVHAVARRRGLTETATIIALMTISTEVGSADGSGNRQWWCPSNPTNDPDSDGFPHDSTSDDNRSSGYFQQQPGPNGEAWWGTASQRMTLDAAADMFLDRLSDDYVNARDAHTAGAFAQLVQGSAFPDRYREKWDEAHEVLARALDGQAPVPAQQQAGWAGDPVWLEDVLRPVLGDKLKTLAGWENSGVGDFGDIWGVMWHHTGNSRERPESIRAGRPDLQGPLANLHIAPDGTVTIVAVGVCNHSGRGSGFGLPANAANNRLIGVECAWPTIHPDGSYRADERWPDAQIISMRDVAAALTTRLGYGAERNIGHKEWAGSAQGKWDPGNLDMDWFRGEIAKAMRGEFSHPAPVEVSPAVAPHLPSRATPARTGNCSKISGSSCADLSATDGHSWATSRWSTMWRAWDSTSRFSNAGWQSCPLRGRRSPPRRLPPKRLRRRRLPRREPPRIRRRRRRLLRRRRHPRRQHPRRQHRRRRPPRRKRLPGRRLGEGPSPARCRQVRAQASARRFFSASTSKSGGGQDMLRPLSASMSSSVMASRLYHFLSDGTMCQGA
ncbi:gp35 protein [Mycolicibacterium conceptionense]|uniref:Gp35 protein n=1 Tax=Mycolicibacterium conceptionense TaxID=451644 RepID=A0A0U1D6S7_9MYCO|nr:gp35 protein [Mycolicibacterium conceptionense]